MKRNASAVWNGGLKDGHGRISTESGVLSDTQYSFSTRFEDGKGTNPEELIAAAHAGCFSMALSGQLGNAGMTAESINTTAEVRLEKVEGGFAITKVHLTVRASIPGADKEAFMTAAKNAKAGCPVSKVFNAETTRNAAWGGYLNSARPVVNNSSSTSTITAPTICFLKIFPPIPLQTPPLSRIAYDQASTSK